MATAAVSNNFTNGTPADAEQVDTNFNDVVAFLNGQVIHKDGSKAMTAAFDAGSQKIVNVTTGTAATDAANVTNVTNSLPVGMMVAYGGAAAPALWLLCDGTAVSRATYADLFTAIGTAFGAGNGTTTFNLPDMRDRYPIGDSGSLTLGGTVGSNDAVAVAHTHTSADHSHPYSGSTSTPGNHTHAFNTVDTPGATLTAASGHGGGNVGVVTTTAGGDHSHTFSGSTSGASDGNTTNSQSPTASGTNANRPASVVVNWIIRAGV